MILRASFATAVALALILLACDSDSPQAPTNEPPPDPCQSDSGPVSLTASITEPDAEEVMVEAGAKVSFTATVTVDPDDVSLRHAWRIDGAEVSDALVHHRTFGVPGVYEVTFVSCVAKTLCCTRDTVTVEVISPPASGLYPAPVTVPDGLRFVGTRFPGAGDRNVLVVAGAEGLGVWDVATGLSVSTRFLTDTPRLGGLVLQEPDARRGAVGEDAVIVFGVGNGAVLTPWDPDTGDFSAFSLGYQGSSTVYDAAPFGGDPASGGCVLALDIRIGFLAFDGGWGPRDDVIVTDFPGGTTPRSAYTEGLGEPILVVSGTGSLYLHPGTPGSPATLVGPVGADPRRIRCANGLCVVTSFEDDALTVVSFDGTTAAIVGDPIDVGDGPVGVDLRALPGGGVAAVTTGFNDGSVWVTTLDASGAVTENDAIPHEAGCTEPAHATWLSPSTIVVSCFGSDQLELVNAVVER